MEVRLTSGLAVPWESPSIRPNPQQVPSLEHGMIAVTKMEGPGLAERFMDHQRRRLIKGLRAEVGTVSGGEGLGAVPKFRKGG